MHAGVMKVTPSAGLEFYYANSRQPARARLANLAVEIEWHDGIVPYSERFEDTYYSRQDGLAEAHHVFLEGTNLPEAWQGRRIFVVGETGFGTGLNFLATWRLWRKTASADARLHYLSVEGFPLSVKALERAHSFWPELESYAKNLRGVYPPIHPGFHRVWLDRGQVALTLLMGDAAAVLREAEAQVDAWFLDGFAPARNPSMWSANVMVEVARLSAPLARLSTFTASSQVRRNLERVGFSVEKKSGFGAKREMLTARFTGPSTVSYVPPWYRVPERADARSVGVLGAGIAGGAVAHAVARRGREVVLVDRRDAVAGEASGNPGALVTPRLDTGDTNAAHFHARAYRMALASIEECELSWLSRGVLRPLAEAEAAWCAHIMASQAGLWLGAIKALEAEEATRKAGVSISDACLFVPSAGVLRPADFAMGLADNAVFMGAHAIMRLETQGNSWLMRDVDDRAVTETDIAVIAAGHASRDHGQVEWLQLEPVLGQLSIVPATLRSRELALSVLRGGYVTPAFSGHHIVGATQTRTGIDPRLWPVPVTFEGHLENLAGSPVTLDGIFGETAVGDWLGRAGLRSSTSDRLPAVGAVVDPARFRQAYGRLRHGPKGRFPPLPPLHNGLYVLTGLGFRGVMTAPLAAEILASQMFGEPWPVERDVALGVSPNRFLVRALMREET